MLDAIEIKKRSMFCLCLFCDEMGVSYSIQLMIISNDIKTVKGLTKEFSHGRRLEEFGVVALIASLPFAFAILRLLTLEADL